MRVEKLEKEVIKYKEKVHELEYFKTRAEVNDIRYIREYCSSRFKKIYSKQFILIRK